MAWQTPESLPTGKFCRRLFIPNSPYLVGCVSGALRELAAPENWEELGAITPEEVAAVFEEMYLLYGEDNYGCMIGKVLPTIGEVQPNELLCDGSTFNDADYPLLAARISSDWSNGDGTFTVPDLRDRFLLGGGGTFAETAQGGETNVTLSENQMPPHTHLETQYTFNLDLEAPGAPDILGLGQPSISVPTSSAGGGQPHNNMPPYQVVRYVVIAG